MPFGQTSTPVSLEEMIEIIFTDMEACICYFNDIFIDSRNTEVEHQAIVEKVL